MYTVKKVNKKDDGIIQLELRTKDQENVRMNKALCDTIETIDTQGNRTTHITTKSHEVVSLAKSQVSWTFHFTFKKL